MATVGRIKCDLCGFVGNLESKHGSAIMTAPAGWATVGAVIHVSGEHSLDKKEREVLRNKIKEKFPKLHVCPRCCIDREVHNTDRLLSGGQSNEHTVS